MLSSIALIEAFASSIDILAEFIFESSNVLPSDDLKSSKYALVFGNSMLIKERVNAAVNLYNEGRIKKMIFI